MPKSPIESALGEVLAGIRDPAWIIDTERGVIVASNGRGGAVWGVPTMSPVLESVTPVLRSLRDRFAQGSFLETTTSTIEALKFWTAGGVRMLACEVRTLHESIGPGLLLVIAGKVARAPPGRRDVTRHQPPPSRPAISVARPSEIPPAFSTPTLPAKSASKTAAASAPRPAPRAAAAQAKLAPALREEPPAERMRPAIVPAVVTADGAPPNDMETLREIARRIRQGSARLTAGMEAPANQDEGPEMPAPAPPSVQATEIDERHAHLAHEIRTPLAAIVSLAEVITEERLGPWPNERYRGYVRDILQSARHGLDVVDSILRDAPDPAEAAPLFDEVDLNAEVEAVRTPLEPLAEKSGACLSAALVTGLPAVRADRRNVRQMLINLISNGIKHGGPQVRIKVTTGYELNGEVWVEVEDNGPGLPAADKTPGRATSRKAGRGLALTRSLAAANNARLEMRSQPGHGVRARLIFSAERNVQPGGAAQARPL